MARLLMKRLLLLFSLIVLVMSAHKANAANCPVSAGASDATIGSTIASCGSGNTVTFAAGTYALTTQQRILPCGVSLAGPTPSSGSGTQPFYSQTPDYTAKLTGNFGIGHYGPFKTTAGCSASQSIQYLEWDGGTPGGNGTVTLDNGECCGTGPNAIAGSLNSGNNGNSCRTQQPGCTTVNGQGWAQYCAATTTSGGGNVNCGDGGGNFLYVTPGTQNLTVSYNYLHGNNCGFLCADHHAILIELGPYGSQSGCCTFPSGYPVTTNVTISWNIFSATSGNCHQAIVWEYNQNTEGGGGTCDGVGIQGAYSNLNVTNNRFMTGDDELKFFEMYDAGNTSGFCSPCTFNYNHFQQWDRIAEEMQINWGGPSEPVLVNSQYSDYSNHLIPMQQDYDISMANGCVYNFNTSNQTNCVNHIDYNLTVADQTGEIDAGYEYWGGNGGTGNGNVWVGNEAAITFQWDPNGNYTYNNNTVMSPQNNGNACNSSCTLQNGQSNPAYPGCPGSNGGYPVFKPSCSGNYSQTSNGSITSVAPILSVSGNTVTITNTNVSTPNGSNPGRDSNTTFWCTTDGSTPSAGGSNSTPYWVGAASQTVGTITASGTIKCLGMWGAPNQPYSYLAASSGGGGYVPSAVVSATTGPPTTTATPLLSLASQTFWPTLSVSVSDSTTGATIFCTTNGATPTPSSPVYTGPFSLSSTTTIKCMATSSGLANSGVASGTYTATPPAITGCYQHNTAANINTMATGGFIQQSVYCQYTGMSDQLCSPGPDVNLSSVSSWGTLAPSVVTAGAVGASGSCSATNQGAGCIYGVGPGTGNTTASVTQNGGAPLACGQWTWTITNSPPTLTGVTISLTGGGSAVTVGAAVQACATFIYTGSISTVECGNSVDAYGSTANTWFSSAGNATISTSGLVTGVTAGTTQISVKATNGSTTVGPSTPQTITINTPVSGSNIKLSGPQQFSGGTILQ
jgi:Chitobiase/beta-hexosaminidase C-terminal domain